MKKQNCENKEKGRELADFNVVKAKVAEIKN